MKRLLPLAALVASPAYADGFKDREIAYQLLNAVDAAQTIDCLKREVCVELNPIYGRDPTPGKIIGVKVVGGVLHYVIARFIHDRDPKGAKVFQIVTIVVQGGVVAANFRFTF